LGFGGKCFGSALSSRSLFFGFGVPRWPLAFFCLRGGRGEVLLSSFAWLNFLFNVLGLRCFLLELCAIGVSCWAFAVFRWSGGRGNAHLGSSGPLFGSALGLRSFFVWLSGFPVGGQAQTQPYSIWPKRQQGMEKMFPVPHRRVTHQPTPNPHPVSDLPAGAVFVFFRLARLK
jgi:hypothetical protein